MEANGLTLGEFSTQLALAVLSTVIAAGCLALLSGLSPIEAGAVCLTIASLWLAVMSTRRYREVLESLTAVGLQSLSPTPTASTAEALGAARTSLEYWSLTGNNVVKSDATVEALARIAQHGGTARFLLLSPDSAYLDQRAEHEDADPEAWRSEVDSTLLRLRKLSSKYKSTIEVRFYDTPPLWRMVRLDRQEILLQWFPGCSRGNAGPEVRLAPTDGSLYWAITAHFDSVWESAVEAPL